MESCGKLLISFFVGFICIYCLVDAKETLHNSCVYTLYVSTGTQLDAGTNSTISAALIDTHGVVVSIPNLVKWGGLMDNTTKYFEPGSVDIFSGRGRCLCSNVCKLNLTSDGTGMYPNWFCIHVSLTSTGDGFDHHTCFQENFTVDQWINKTQPFSKDKCNSSTASSSHHYSKNPSAASDPLRFNNILLPIITN